jgi:hypothetical protein
MEKWAFIAQLVCWFELRVEGVRIVKGPKFKLW